MGIKDILRLCNFSDFADVIKRLQEQGIRKIGVDMYVIFYRFAIDVDIAATLVNEPKAYIKHYYEKMFNFLKKFLEQGFELYLVYEGSKMKYKIVDEERQKRREAAKQSGNYISALKIDPQQVENFELYIKDYKIPSIVSAHEADAQLAYMYRQGLIDCVLTNDSDLIVYQVSKIIYIRPDGLKLYESLEVGSDKPTCMNEVPKEHLFLFGYLIGCDYFKGVPGIGYKKAFDLIKETKRGMNDEDMFEDVYSRIVYKKKENFLKKLPSKEVLYKMFTLVKYIFNKQCVKDPRTGEIKYLDGKEIVDKEEFGRLEILN